MFCGVGCFLVLVCFGFCLGFVFLVLSVVFRVCGLRFVFRCALFVVRCLLFIVCFVFRFAWLFV